MQPPSPAMDLESQMPPPSQQRPSPPINPLESPRLALQFAQPQSNMSVSFLLLSFAILLIFSALLVSAIIGKKFPRASKAMEKVAILLAATAFFTIAIPLPLGLKCATWTIYVICLLIVAICNCFIKHL